MVLLADHSNLILETLNSELEFRLGLKPSDRDLWQCPNQNYLDPNLRHRPRHLRQDYSDLVSGSSKREMDPPVEQNHFDLDPLIVYCWEPADPIC